jgi:hypothetical protein
MKRKREIIKKVIAYMTLGIDVSRLFSEMVMVSTAKLCAAAWASADRAASGPCLTLGPSALSRL